MSENDNGQEHSYLAQQREHNEQIRYYSVGAAERLTTSDKPTVVAHSARSLAMAHLTDFFHNENLTPNRFATQGLLARTDERMDNLALGHFGKKTLHDLGYRDTEMRAMSPDLKPKERSELVGSLQKVKEELVEMDRFNNIIHLLMQNVGSLEAEIGLWGSWREEGLSSSMLKAIGEMGPLVEGETPFGDKVTIALRAFLEVSNRRAQSFGVPPIFAMEPTLGGKHMALAYAFRSIEYAREEKDRVDTFKLYDNARPYYKDPLGYLLKEAFPQATEDLSQGLVLADLLPEERARLVEERERGDVPPLPDVFNNLGSVLANPRLADTLKATILGYYLFRFFRLDVDGSIQPRPDAKVEEGSILHTKYGFPVGTTIWHVENGPQAGDLVNMMYWIARQVEERYGRGEDKAARWSGPNSLFLGVPNMCRPLPDSMFWMRESAPGEAKGRQALSFRRLLFEDTKITDPKTGRERRLYLRDLDWDDLYVDEAFFNEYLGDQGRGWGPGIPPREDFALQNYLSRSYQLKWVWQRYIAYEKDGDNFNSAVSLHQHNRGKKKEELSFGTLNPIANEITGSAAHQGLLDMQRANMYGSALAEHYLDPGPDPAKPGPTPEWGEGASFLADKVFNAPEGSVLYQFPGPSNTELQTSTRGFDASVFEIIFKMVVARKLPTSDTPEGRSRIRTFAAMIRTVALEKRSLYPAEAAACGCFGPSEGTGKILGDIKDSHLYEPYNFLAEVWREDMMSTLKDCYDMKESGGKLPKPIAKALTAECVEKARAEYAKVRASKRYPVRQPNQPQQATPRREARGRR